MVSTDKCPPLILNVIKRSSNSINLIYTLDSISNNIYLYYIYSCQIPTEKHIIVHHALSWNSIEKLGAYSLIWINMQVLPLYIFSKV